MALMEDGQSPENHPLSATAQKNAVSRCSQHQMQGVQYGRELITSKEAEPEAPAEPAEPEKRIRRTNPVVLLLVPLEAVMGSATFTYSNSALRG